MKSHYPAVFLAGASVMALEITGTRILSPFYGNTIYVWTSLICTALAFLSLGYRVGGKTADKKNIFYPLLFFAGFTSSLVPVFSQSILVFTEVLGPVYGSLSSALLIFSVPLTLLGMSLPHAIKLNVSDVDFVGSGAGDISALSTFGSLFGALLSGFVLIPILGVSWIIYLFAFSLMIVSAPFILGWDKRMLSLFIVFLLPMFSSSQVNLFEGESHYGRVLVGEQDGMRVLVVDGTSQSCVRLEDMRECYSYIRIIADAKPPGETLIIGLGGGQLSGLIPKADSVEIDPVVVEAARMHFGYGGQAFIADGRSYLRNTDKKYSYIVLDVLSGYSLPGHLVTRESFMLMRDRLEPGGGVAVNIIARPGDEVSAAVYSTLKSVFPHVGAKYTSKEKLGNVIFFASMMPIGGDFAEIPEGLVLSDDFNPIDYMRLDIVRELRKEYRRYIGQIIY